MKSMALARVPYGIDGLAAMKAMKTMKEMKSMKAMSAMETKHAALPTVMRHELICGPAALMYSISIQDLGRPQAHPFREDVFCG